MNRENKIIAGIVFSVFLVSLALSFWLKVPPEVDARAYDRIAMNLISGNGYVEKAGIPAEQDFSIARVGPGYEFFLAGVYKIFGHHYEAVWILQAIMQALIALFVFLISKQIFKNNWNLIIGYSSALLAGFSPDLLVASSMMLTETFGIFFMAICVYLFLKYFESNSWKDLFLFALFFALAVLTRSQLAAFAPVFAVMFFARKQWLKMAVFGFIILALFSPWVVRNYKIYREFIPFNAAIGHNLWDGNHAGASGEMENNHAPMIEYAKDHTPQEVNKKGIEEFKIFVKTRPLEFLKITLKRISVFFSFSRPSGFWPSFTPKQQAINAFFSLIGSVVIFTFGIVGALFAWKNLQADGRKKFLYVLALAISVPVSVMMILVESRYRYPLYLFLATFGGLAVFEIWSGNRKENIKTVLMVFAILSANSILDFVFNFEKFWDKISGILK